ncbi:MAG: hypothetical protein ACHQK9_24280 [Reyranellales bacterium]
MRHLLVTAALILVALVVTFGTASVLQGIATARKDTNTMPEPVIAQPAKTGPTKLRPSEQGRQVIFAARRTG